MKILQIIHDFLPRHMAGSEIYTYKLTKELQNRGHEVELLFTEHRPEKKQYELERRDFDGIECTEVAFNHSYSNFQETYLKEQMDDIFSGVLDRFEPDLIHIQHLLYHSLNYLKIAAERNLPVFYTLHDYWLTCPDMKGGIRFDDDLNVCEQVDVDKCAGCIAPKLASPDRYRDFLYEVNRALVPDTVAESEIYKKFGRGMLSLFNSEPEIEDQEELPDKIQKRNMVVKNYAKYVNVFISPSKFLKGKYVDFGIDEDKIKVSDYGFDLEPFEKFRISSSENLRFAFIGTPSPHKGLHLLVEVFNNFNDTSAQLDIYGDLSIFGEYGKMVKNMVDSDDIGFHGKFDNSNLTDIYSNIDVLVVPSLWFENSPLTIHEAFLAGIPVIASDYGGMKELVQNGKDGLLFERGSKEDLKKTIARFINNPKLVNELEPDPDKVKSIAENAREMEQLYASFLEPS